MMVHIYLFLCMFIGVVLILVYACYAFCVFCGLCLPLRSHWFLCLIIWDTLFNAMVRSGVYMVSDSVYSLMLRLSFSALICSVYVCFVLPCSALR